MGRTIMIIRKVEVVSVFISLLQSRIFHHLRRFSPETPTKGQITTTPRRKSRMKKWSRIMKVTFQIKIANYDELEERTYGLY